MFIFWGTLRIGFDCYNFNYSGLKEIFYKAANSEEKAKCTIVEPTRLAAEHLDEHMIEKELKSMEMEKKTCKNSIQPN